MSEQAETLQKKVESELQAKVREWDLYDSYTFFRNYSAEDSLSAFVALKKCVEFGKELLPTDCEDVGVRKRLAELHTRACEVLVEARPARRSVKFEFQDFGADRVIPIYRLLASDADEAHAREEELDKVLANFTAQQFEQHMGELQAVDNLIFHELVVLGIVKAKIQTIDELIDERIKSKMIGAKHDDSTRN